MITEKTIITVKAIVNTPIAKVWELYTDPKHIVKWNTPSKDWHTTKAENDLKIGGKFLSRMEAKDGSFGFDFSGIYNDVKLNETIVYTIDDGRNVSVNFTEDKNTTTVVIKFEAETQNSIEMQKGGWQSILNCFKSYAETND
ncbi:SRPBCC domain-containing protein [Tenacibaculum caenipelagi]|uniref:Uncharacterized protein YndB with AHSA1/START domain n=1 Tax=Tenacibaculum caenipelagi TaxID=1325435 RepID=A0A4R6TEV9_9FLAO|nr:SRPBCC domain-containing protein [Tenacibaculum caenipelagi]TDQ28747.1 uncharacterized protein YndB with AHSA1/START domain [Tenacibaculum caenipelagi]